MKYYQWLITIILFSLSFNLLAEVLPDGRYTESILDLKVKVLGGYVRVQRIWDDNQWHINQRWDDLKIEDTNQIKEFKQSFGFSYTPLKSNWKFSRHGVAFKKYSTPPAGNRQKGQADTTDGQQNFNE